MDYTTIPNNFAQKSDCHSNDESSYPIGSSYAPTLTTHATYPDQLTQATTSYSVTASDSIDLNGLYKANHSCEKPDHAHTWVSEGKLEIERCEHYCLFCRGEKAKKRWSSAWFLRRHVRETHVKYDFPDLEVCEGWSKRPAGNTRPINKKQRAPGSNKKRSGTKKDRAILDRALQAGLIAINNRGRFVVDGNHASISMRARSTPTASLQSSPVTEHSSGSSAWSVGNVAPVSIIHSPAGVITTDATHNSHLSSETDALAHTGSQFDLAYVSMAQISATPSDGSTEQGVAPGTFNFSAYDWSTMSQCERDLVLLTSPLIPSEMAAVQAYVTTTWPLSSDLDLNTHDPNSTPATPKQPQLSYNDNATPFTQADTRISLLTAAQEATTTNFDLTLDIDDYANAQEIDAANAWLEPIMFRTPATEAFPETLGEPTCVKSGINEQPGWTFSDLVFDDNEVHDMFTT